MARGGRSCGDHLMVLDWHAERLAGADLGHRFGRQLRQQLRRLKLRTGRTNPLFHESFAGLSAIEQPCGDVIAGRHIGVEKYARAQDQVRFGRFGEMKCATRFAAGTLVGAQARLADLNMRFLEQAAKSQIELALPGVPPRNIATELSGQHDSAQAGSSVRRCCARIECNDKPDGEPRSAKANAHGPDLTFKQNARQIREVEEFKVIKIGDRYTLVERIGQGGMGEVWLARDEGPDGFRKTVVVKRLLPEAARHLDYFKAEARLVAGLPHQNIVQVIGFLKDEGGQYNIVMEYVEGCDLVELIFGDRGVLGIDMAIYIAAEALKGLDFAHTARIEGSQSDLVHRDVSPHNILVSYGAEVKLTDFGVAKASLDWRHQTLGPQFRGKYSYAPPEAMDGKVALDRRADIYSMGVVLYEMLTRRHAFSGSMVETYLAVREGKVTPLRTLNPEVPPELEAVVMRMMHPDRDARPPSAQAARTQLVSLRPGWAVADAPLKDLIKEVRPRRRLSSPFMTNSDLAALNLPPVPPAPRPRPQEEPEPEPEDELATTTTLSPTSPSYVPGGPSLGPATAQDPLSTLANLPEATTQRPAEQSEAHRGFSGVHLFLLLSGVASATMVSIAIWLLLHPKLAESAALDRAPSVTAPDAAVALNAAAMIQTQMSAEILPPKHVEPEPKPVVKPARVPKTHPSAAVEPRSPSGPDAVSTGLLVVTRDANLPSVDVYVDDVLVGRAPIRYLVSVGLHKIDLQYDARKKIMRRERVEPDKQTIINAL